MSAVKPLREGEVRLGTTTELAEYYNRYWAQQYPASEAGEPLPLLDNPNPWVPGPRRPRIGQTVIIREPPGEMWEFRRQPNGSWLKRLTPLQLFLENKRREQAIRAASERLLGNGSRTEGPEDAKTLGPQSVCIQGPFTIYSLEIVSGEMLSCHVMFLTL
jgi:hypothetical protein